MPRLTESQVKNLERYIAEGGGVGVFLGPKVDPVAYNKLMHRERRRLLPRPLAARTDQAADRGREAARGRSSLSKQILLRDSRGQELTPRSAASTPTTAATSRRPATSSASSSSRTSTALADPRLGQVARGPVRPGDSSACRTTRRSRLRGAARRLAHQGCPRRYGEPKFEKYRAAVDEQFDEDSLAVRHRGRRR